MKTVKKVLIAKYVLMSFTTLAVVLFSFSCARKVSFLTSTEVPAAQGDVKVTKSSNENFEIKISLLHLAAPDRLKPPKEAYVVWIETEDHLFKNQGQIKSNTSFLSKKLKASFETVSPFNPVKVFITAEDEPNIQYPRGVIVLTTDIF